MPVSGNSNPSVSNRRSIDVGLGRQDSAAAADGPFSPVGLKVLVVDDDPMCLKVVSAMLKRCNYEVETRSNGQEALSLLRERQDEDHQFDLVLSDVYMPDMDGFKLLEQIGLELEIPVIMMSSNGDTNVVLRGVTHGAVDFLIKPVRVEELRNVWQHVIRRRTVTASRTGDDASVDYDEGSRHGTKRKDSDALRAEHELGSAGKKPRVIWSAEMHQQFVAAVNHLGIDKAFPKRILDLMNVEGLTRENVASHLQKYRLYLKRMQLQGVTPGMDDGNDGNGDAADAMTMHTCNHQPMDLVSSGTGMQRAASALYIKSESSPMPVAGTGTAAPPSPQVPPTQQQQQLEQQHQHAMMANFAAWQTQQTMAMQAAAAVQAAAGPLPQQPHFPPQMMAAAAAYPGAQVQSHLRMSAGGAPAYTLPPTTAGALPLPPLTAAAVAAGANNNSNANRVPSPSPGSMPSSSFLDNNNGLRNGNNGGYSQTNGGINGNGTSSSSAGTQNKQQGMFGTAPNGGGSDTLRDSADLPASMTLQHDDPLLLSNLGDAGIGGHRAGGGSGLHMHGNGLQDDEDTLLLSLNPPTVPPVKTEGGVDAYLDMFLENSNPL